MRKIALGHLNISSTGKAYVQKALDNNRLSRGEFTERFEKEFAQLHNVKHAVFMNSGTSALQVALAALKEVYHYEDGDEVLVPATTFIATSNIVIQNNMKPIFVDVDPITYNMNPEEIYDKITYKTRCIIPVHLFGLPADMKTIAEIAITNNLQVLEDSCEAVGVKTNGQSVGSWGNISAFSTYVNHLIVGGVGGLVTTSNDRLAEISRSLMAHGRDSIYTNIDVDDDLSSPEFRNIIERRFRFERVGYSYRATELEAAIALSELENFQENLLKRRKRANELTALLGDLRALQLPTIPANFEHAFMMYPIVLDERYNLDTLLFYLEERGIETRLMFPLLSQPVYAKMFPGLAENYPVAQRLARQGFFIGVHQGLTLCDRVYDDINYISDTFHNYFRSL